jgi:hypothetical protein
MKFKLKENHLLIFFLIFWFFTVIGSTLYIGSTMLSVRNILFTFIPFLIYFLRKYPMNRRQINIFLPIGLLFIYGTITMLINGINDIEVVKDYFYFSYIPLLYVSIMLLSNRLNNTFFTYVKKFAYFLIFFLFAFTLFEFITDIHLPVHTPNRYHIPSTFFTNANDLSVIMIQLLMLVSVLKKKSDSQCLYRIAFLLTTFVVFVTLSRLALVAFIIISISIFLSKEFKRKDLIINSLVIILTLVYLSIDIPSPKNSSTVVDRSKTRISSMTHFDEDEDDLNSLDDYQNLDLDSEITISSTRIRMDIYRIPFRNPSEFIFGNSFNSDKEIITKHRTLPYKIVNSHSYFIQIIFYFGWIGLGLMVLFFGALGVFALGELKSMSYFLPVILTQALLLNIPSSVMRFPLVWIPFFITIAYYTNLKKEK